MTNMLSKRTAIVTGAGQGIGRAIAQKLAAEGAGLLLIGRTAQSLDETAHLIRIDGGVVRTAIADISRQEQVDGALAQVAERWSSIDILVNNAAVFDEPPFLDLDVKTFRRTFEINVTGTFVISLAVARRMVDQRKGSIVHISSIDAFGADGPVSAYSATKAAVSSLARSMTLELAPLGIRVNCVAPGFVNTDMVHKTSTPAVLEHMLHGFQRVPLRRLVEPEEIGAAVAFLASDAASAIAGTTLVVDGGTHVEPLRHGDAA